VSPEDGARPLPYDRERETAAARRCRRKGIGVDQARTKSTYDLQWNRFRIVRPEEDRFTFYSRTGLEPEELRGALVLDAGCGMGRYLRIAAEAGARVIGLELSGAARAAREMTAEFPNVQVVRGDLLQPPFAPDSFDHIYSIGVLDHTPNPPRALCALARLLKPGGRIAFWIYRRERLALEWIMDAHRAVSTRLPLGVLMALCRFSAPIGGLKRRMMQSRSRVVARMGVALNLMTIGVSMHPDPEVRVCDTLDWYAPKFASRHRFEDVARWCAAAGLESVRDLTKEQSLYHAGQGVGINVVAYRPSSRPDAS
jgi:SAM-dependent methyltransferase